MPMLSVLVMVMLVMYLAVAVKIDGSGWLAGRSRMEVVVGL